MIAQTAVIFWTMLAVGSSSEKVKLSDSEVAISRCAAVAEMLASAYATYPDDVQLRTKLINQEREKLQSLLGTTDLHLMSAYVAVAFYDGKRLTGTIAKSEPIDEAHIAAKGAANCMAAIIGRSTP